MQAFVGEGFLLRFAFGVILGLGFSMAVILSTSGIMDGFQNILKNGLAHSGGDFYFYSRDRFFTLDPTIKKGLSSLGIENYLEVLQTESFISPGDNSHSQKSMGILLRGINNDPQEIKNILGLNLELKEGEISLGKELALQLKVKPGDSVNILLATAQSSTQNNSEDGLPAAIFSFRVKSLVDHGIYPKDLRLAYIPKIELERIFNASGKNNLIIFKRPLTEDSDQVFSDKFHNIFSDDFILRASWQEFSHLIEAAQIEKVILSLILQIIVVVAIFNVSAFIVYLNEKKSKELFLFRSLGVSQKQVFLLWGGIILFIWGCSLFCSLIFVQIFNLLLAHHTWFQLPGLIYNIERLRIDLMLKDYLIVFFSALLWLILISIFTLKKIGQRYLLVGIKKEN